MAHRFPWLLPRSRTLPLGQKLGLPHHPAMTKYRLDGPLVRRYSFLDLARLEVEQIHRFPLDKQVEPVFVIRMKQPEMQLYLVACIPPLFSPLRVPATRSRFFGRTRPS
jgi:hypothetical protein